ncbi:error-prone DNA polymerase [Catelliglobosispora koreensis]|uniref:error-prone DNA polymerase n=1 Tax=Catelliglobosispora koreensis TaxID=129052 RepID=UPI00036546E7|nr:error-prone DNA polymerase [Catelliglobosispora koreensis]
MPWQELHRHLQAVADPLAAAGDLPVSRKRERPPPVEVERGHSTVPYAELHCHSNFSFLDGASEPEELVAEAVRLGLTGLAVTDHDGFYGVVRFANAAAEAGLPTVFGAELSLGLPGPQNGIPDPAGNHLLVLARGQSGYHKLAGVIGDAQLEGKEKGRPVYDLGQAAARLKDHVLVLTGCRKGAVPAAIERGDLDLAACELDRLTALFGKGNVAVELTCHGAPTDLDRIDALADLAGRFGLPLVATNNVHYHQPARRKLATIMAAVRARTSLDGIDPWLPAAATAHLRSGDEMARLLHWYPQSVPYAATLAAELAFNLRHIAPDLPPFPVPAGHDEASWLRHQVMLGAAERYGPPQAHPEAYAQIEHELELITRLNFPGYFLVVWDLVRFCRESGILCQGRGSAANSAVCYALYITNVDAVQHRLLFERFLAPERDGPPDIDIDIESDRREEVIQYVYRTHGRRHTAQVANVISYRPKSAVRDVAKAFGHSPGQQDAWSKQIERWSEIKASDVDGIPGHVIDFANEIMRAPRHLGIHSGGMVICDRPVTEVVPVEWARMENRSVLQWDKDSCADAGLVKFDLLGLGMLSALRYCYEFLGQQLDLGRMRTDDPEVYEMLCQADTVGVFQVESRAQMATLPRLRPREFYDIVVEVALIRPGPIQGGAVHPYINRRNGKEDVTYAHPLMRNALEKTLGVVLFQEQVMQLAIDVAGFTAEESDKLRRAMGSKRSEEKMLKLKATFDEGCARNDVPQHIADDLFLKMAAFASYGFPESHAMSFAYLVYASAWLKRYYPGPFCAALLKAYPLGFYSPQSVVDDARRHGVEVRRPDINLSQAKACIESTSTTRWGSYAGQAPSRWGLDGPAVRLGLDQVRSISEDLAELIVTERDKNGDYLDMPDLARRCQLKTIHLEALATSDAFACFGLDRRQALWQAGAAAQEKADRLPGTIAGVHAPTLPGMDDRDRLVADVWATGLSPDNHPIGLVRENLDAQQVLPVIQLKNVPDKTRVSVGGLVTHRQRPGTARGVTFMSLEDETGICNVVVSQGVWARFRHIARRSPALIVRGRLEVANNVRNLIADKITALPISAQPGASRDFR